MKLKTGSRLKVIATKRRPRSRRKREEVPPEKWAASAKAIEQKSASKAKDVLSKLEKDEPFVATWSTRGVRADGDPHHTSIGREAFESVLYKRWKVLGRPTNKNYNLHARVIQKGDKVWLMAPHTSLQSGYTVGNDSFPVSYKYTYKFRPWNASKVTSI